jgi:hypothetical protein
MRRHKRRVQIVGRTNRLPAALNVASSSGPMKYEVQLTYFSLNFLQIAKKKSAGTTLARD